MSKKVKCICPHHHLTVDTVYEVIEEVTPWECDPMYKIVDDEGTSRCFNQTRFVDIEEEVEE